MRYVRSFLAIVFGLVTCLAGLITVEVISSWLHPWPPGADTSDPEVCRAQVASYPAGVLVLVGVLGWCLVAALGSWTATRWGTGRHPAHGIVVAVLFCAALFWNMAMLPYPAWFWINALLAPAAAWGGIHLARRTMSDRTPDDNPPSHPA